MPGRKRIILDTNLAKLSVNTLSFHLFQFAIVHIFSIYEKTRCFEVMMMVTLQHGHLIRRRVYMAGHDKSQPKEHQLISFPSTHRL